jgi:hypothetical protein
LPEKEENGIPWGNPFLGIDLPLILPPFEREKILPWAEANSE